MKTQVMSIKDFMNYEKEPFLLKVERHLKKYGKVYKVAGLAAIILITPHGAVFASGGIDVEAGKLYKQLVSVGRWIIVFKAAIEMLKSLSNGDIESGKRIFFTHLMVYLLLLGLPYGLEKVDQVFASINK